MLTAVLTARQSMRQPRCDQDGNYTGESWLSAEGAPTLPWTRMRACHWFLRLLLPTPMYLLVRWRLVYLRLGSFTRSFLSIALTSSRVLPTSWGICSGQASQTSTWLLFTKQNSLLCKIPLHNRQRTHAAQNCSSKVWSVQATQNRCTSFAKLHNARYLPEMDGSIDIPVDPLDIA